MIKREAVVEYAKYHGLSKTQAEKEIKRFTDFVSHQLECHSEVRLCGFGVFGTKLWEPRTMTNPMTKEPVEVPARRTPFFKISPTLRKRILK